MADVTTSPLWLLMLMMLSLMMMVMTVMMKGSIGHLQIENKNSLAQENE
jgi:hypothetical protein